jgi:hypothetical protein
MVRPVDRRSGRFAWTAFLLGIVALSASAGDNAGAWLLEPVGARTVALQAYTPLADDAATITLSPAGLARLEDVEVLLYTRESAYDARENYLGVVLPLGTGALGVAWRNAGVGDSDDAPFIYTDAAGNDIGRGEYKANAFSIAYGYSVNDRFQVGGGFDIAMDKLAGLEGTEFADDDAQSGFGGLHLGVAGVVQDALQYGLALRHLGGSLGEDASIPVTLSAGVAMDFLGDGTSLLSVDFQKEFVDLAESTTQIRLGTEYRLDRIALRLGTSQSADRSQWFAGFGVDVAPLRVDYAYQLVNRARNRLSDTPRHFVSLSYHY